MLFMITHNWKSLYKVERERRRLNIIIRYYVQLASLGIKWENETQLAKLRFNSTAVLLWLLLYIDAAKWVVSS